ncbi:MAG: ATP-binding protein [Clostridia bacterium]|nr:ATP-binding protein [Clostridia bacterium]
MKLVGIPDNIMQNIFKEYNTTKEYGSGIGLTSSYNSIVSDFLGEMECKTEKGKGTIFTIILPLNKNKKKKSKL